MCHWIDEPELFPRLAPCPFCRLDVSKMIHPAPGEQLQPVTLRVAEGDQA